MHRLGGLLSIISCSLLFSALCSAHVAAGETVLIGYSGPLSGLSASYGKSMMNAVQLAIDETNQRRNIIAGKKVFYKLSAHDDREDTHMAVTVAKYLVQSPVVGVIGNTNTTNSMSTAPLFEAARLAHISPSTSGRNYTRMGYRSSFRAIGHDEQAIDILVPYLLDDLHMARIAMINSRTQFGTGIGAQFAQALRENGADLLIHDTVSGRTFDFNAALNHIRHARVELIFFGGSVEQAVMLARSIKRKHIKARLVSAMAGVAGEYFRNNAGVDGEGSISLEYGLPAEKMPGWNQFAARYRKTFSDQINPFTVCAYDATKVLIAAIEQANSTDRKRIVDALHTIHYHGVTGAIAFDARGDLIKPFFTLYEMHNLRWHAVKIVQAKNN